MAISHILPLILAATAALATPIQELDASPDYRLPQLYGDITYDLKLAVPADSLTSKSDKYTGTVSIKFKLLQDTKVIPFHVHRDFITVKKLTFNNIVYLESDYKGDIDNVTNILSLTVVNPVKVNLEYTLIVEFEGRLSTTDMYGFYKSSYVDKKGNTTYLATTQFEPTHARRAFPCFDEPSLKGVFTVTISYPAKLSVLFNTNPAKPGTTTDGVTTVTFENTPKMSTYLLAFIISEFTCTGGDNIDIATYQVCSRNDTAEKRDFAVEVGPKLLSALSDLTSYRYSKNMKKMTQVAIPDFSAGAMENWGLITYRETALLFDEEQSSNKYRQSIATTIAHELTHQWFGNLVTCGWWSETFLNEGFATYFQYFIAHTVFPDWELDKQFVLEQLQSVLDSDELANTQALQSDCASPTEISAKFGDISYNKGGSILRMVSHILGESNFIAGLRLYLTNNEFTGAKPEQLWNILDTTVDNTISKLPANLSDIMENWTKKPGFPLLTVKLNGGSVSITQERFLLSGSDNKTHWYVPITYTSSEDKKKFESTAPALWLSPDEEGKLEFPENASWLILNNQETGYYRVNYDDTLWGYIKTALNKNNYDGITEINRAQIVDDLFSLAKASKISYVNTFNTTSFLTKDTSYYPWYAAFQGYDFLLRRVGTTSALGKAISSFLLNRMRSLYESVPLNKQNDTDQIYTLKQVLALTWACKLEEENCVTNIQTYFAQYKASKTKPDKNLRSIVYCNGLRYSQDTTDWDFLWEEYTKSADVATERATIITALGCTRNPSLLEKYLEKTITDDSGIRSQDAASVFSSVYTGNPEGVSVAYDFLTKNHKKIAEKYQSMNSLSNLIKGIAERFTTQEEADKLEDFIATGDIQDEFKVAATQALEVAKSNVKWVQTFEQELLDFFGIVPGAAVTVSVSSLMVLLVAVITIVFIS